MARKASSLAHTKWLCKYHIAFTPKYGRKAICSRYRKDLGEILRRLCMWKGGVPIVLSTGKCCPRD